MAITKTEILEAINTDISDTETRLTNLMSTGSILDPTDKAQLDSYTRTLCLLNDTKTYVTDNL